MRFEPGNQFADRYRILEVIDQGGVGTVLKAEDTWQNRIVAVKVFDRIDTRDLRRMETMRQRADDLARLLKHPGVVVWHDFNDYQGLPYLVTGYVDQSLTDVLQREGQQDPERALAIISQVGAVLSHIHSRGIVHRAIKPSNILFSSDGRILLSGGGLSEVFDTGSFTKAESVPGRVEYMSPEQVTGQPLDYRSDVYSLAVVLYEMLAGKPPFLGGDPIDIARRHVEYPRPSLRKFAPDVSKELEQVVLKAMARQPSERYQSIDEFTWALQSVSRLNDAAGNVSGNGTTDHRTKQLWIMMGTIALLGLYLSVLLVIGGPWKSRPAIVVPGVTASPPAIVVPGATADASSTKTQTHGLLPSVSPSVTPSMPSEGHVHATYPGRMTVNQSDIVSLEIMFLPSPAQSLSGTIFGGTTITAEIGLVVNDRRVRTDVIRVYPSIKAELIAASNSFDVTPGDSDNRRIITTMVPAAWTWTISPKQPGRQTITLNIFGLTTLDTKEANVLERSMTWYIEVSERSLPKKLSDSIVSNLPLLLSTSGPLGLILAWLAFKVNRSDKKVKDEIADLKKSIAELTTKQDASAEQPPT